MFSKFQYVLVSTVISVIPLYNVGKRHCTFNFNGINQDKVYLNQYHLELASLNKNILFL